MDELNFGYRIEKLLQERNIPKSVFYEDSGVTLQLLSDWKRRDQVPNAKTAFRIAQYFGVTIEYLITGETTNPLQAKVDELNQKLAEIRKLVS